MARFYGGVQGNKGEATRLGSKTSGLDAFVDGWDVGVHVRAYVRPDGTDAMNIFPNGGSNGGPHPPVTIQVDQKSVVVRVTARKTIHIDSEGNISIEGAEA